MQQSIKQQPKLTRAEWARAQFGEMQQKKAAAISKFANQLIGISKQAASIKFKKLWPGILENVTKDIATKGDSFLSGTHYTWSSDKDKWPYMRKEILGALTEGLFIFKVQEALLAEGFTIKFPHFQTNSKGYVDTSTKWAPGLHIT